MLSNQRRSTNSHIAGHVSNTGTNISSKCQTSNFTPSRRPWDSLHVERPEKRLGMGIAALLIPAPRPAPNRIKQARHFSFGFFGKLGSMAARMRLAALRILHCRFGHCFQFASSGMIRSQARMCMRCKYAVLAHLVVCGQINIGGWNKIRRKVA